MPARLPWGDARRFHYGCASTCRRSDRLSSFVHTPSHLHEAHYQEAPHHEALITPGTSPASANWRKQMRHSLNFRRNPRGRPHRKHRLRCRQLSFGVWAALAIASFSSLAILAVVAIVSPPARGRAFRVVSTTPDPPHRSWRWW